MNSEERKQFMAERQSGLGGTDAAAIAGENPYKSPMEVYREKLGLQAEKKMNQAMEWGIRLEGNIREKFNEVIQDRTQGDIKIVTDQTFFQHKDHPFLIGHVDGILTNGKPQGILECKTASPYMRAKFGDEWTDQVPSNYLIQCQHYMGITDFPITYVAVLFGGQEFVIYEIERNENLIKNLFDLEISFWNEHIVGQTPPEIDGSDASAQVLKEMYPKDDGGEIIVTDNILPYCNDLYRLRQEADKTKSNIAIAKNEIVNFMGTNSIVIGPNFRISYKKPKDGKKVDWETVAKSLNPSEELVKEHTSITENSRRFVPGKLSDKE